jgi:hypothetical protein
MEDGAVIEYVGETFSPRGPGADLILDLFGSEGYGCWVFRIGCEHEQEVQFPAEVHVGKKPFRFFLSKPTLKRLGPESGVGLVDDETMSGRI